jgi:hypothetical protein
MRTEVPADQARRGKASKMQLTGIPLLLGEEIDEIGIKKEHMWNQIRMTGQMTSAGLRDPVEFAE